MKLAPTSRLVVVAALVAIVAIGAGYASDLRPALFGLDAIVVSATIVDTLLAARRRVEIERDVAAIFSVGRPNGVSIQLRNRSGRTIRGILGDDPIADASAIGLPASFTLAPHGSATVRYEITPTRRGPRDLGAITVRYASPLGLVARLERAPCPARVDVYPDVHAARALELLRRQGRADTRLGSLRVRGGETEFERLRAYQRGDEIRHVDWRATARRGEVAVRQYQSESNQNVVFAIDIGRAMRGESEGLTSVDHALNAALLTADVALRGGDKAGLFVFDDAPRSFLEPTGGRSGGRKLARAGYALEAGFAATDFHGAASYFRARVRARSLFVLFTNLLEPRSARELAAALKGLLPRHLPLCVLLRDNDVEALATAPINGADDLYTRAAAAEALAWRDGIVHSLASSGVLVLDARPHELTPALVKRYLEVKARRLL